MEIPKFYIGQEVICLDVSGDTSLQFLKKYKVVDTKICAGCKDPEIAIGINRKAHDPFYQTCSCGHSSLIRSYYYYRSARFVNANEYDLDPEKFKYFKAKPITYPGINISNAKSIQDNINALFKIRRTDNDPFPESKYKLDEIAELCSRSWNVPSTLIMQKYQNNRIRLRLIQDSFILLSYYYSNNSIDQVSQALRMRSSTLLDIIDRFRTCIFWQFSQRNRNGYLEAFYEVVNICHTQCPDLINNNFTFSIQYKNETIFDVEEYLTVSQVNRISIKNATWFQFRKSKDERVYFYNIHNNITNAVKIINADHIAHLINAQEFGYRFVSYKGWENIKEVGAELTSTQDQINPCTGCAFNKTCPMALDDIQFLQYNEGLNSSPDRFWCPKTAIKHNSTDYLKVTQNRVNELFTLPFN